MTLFMRFPPKTGVTKIELGERENMRSPLATVHGFTGSTATDSISSCSLT